MSVSQASQNLLEEGLRRQREGFRAHAARLYRRVGPDDACYADALNLLGALRLEEGRIAEAIELIERALRSRPDHAVAWGNLGSTVRRLRGPRVAAACFRRSIVLAPDSVDGAVGLSRIDPGALRITLLDRAFQVSPLDQRVHMEIGSDLVRRGDRSAAARWYRRLLAVHPAASAALFALGNALRDLGAPDVAECLYRRTLCILPGSGNVLNNLGLLAFERADWTLAEERFAAASRGDPRLAAARTNRARALQKLGRDAEAVRPYKRGLLIEPTSLAAYCEIAGLLADRRWALRAMALDPGAPEPFNRLAVLATMNNPQRAGVMTWLRRGATLKPDDPDVWHNIGVEHGRAGDPERAALYGTRATRVSSRHVAAHLNTALALLLLERFREGWRMHARRLETPEAAAIRRRFAIPQWTTESLAGRHLLLWGEQGIGDEVQFLTLVPYLLRRGVRLTILTEARLRPLVRRSFPGVAVPDAPAPDGAIEGHRGADLHLAFGDLPHRLDLFCGGDAAPEPWIVPEAGRVSGLRSHLLARHAGKRLVGITWRSAAPKTGARRTIPPRLWRGLAQVPGIALVSLQYAAEEAEFAAFEAEAGLSVDNSHGVEPVHDLDGLAGLVAAVDLVVCPANNTVHFAGALGKPCWTLLPTKPDWRWGLHRTDSLWYPQTAVYRQEVDDDWAPVMARVAADLAIRAGDD